MEYPSIRYHASTVNFLDDSLEITLGDAVFKMIRVEGGTFDMGGTSEQGEDARDNEFPVHTVTLSSYYIGEIPVTQCLWQTVMGTEPRYMGRWKKKYGRGADYPAYNVNYDDIVCNFLPALKHLTGLHFRLPTEAEWEYAARGGKTGGTKYAGSDSIDSVTWQLEDKISRKIMSHPVKVKLPNSLGLYEMSDNGDEWCSDWYAKYDSHPQTNPKGPLP